MNALFKLKYSVLTVLLLGSVNGLMAQNTLIDSLKRRLQRHVESDTPHVDLLLTLINYERSFEPQRAMQRNDTAIALSKKLNYKTGLAFAYNSAGLILSFSLNDQLKANKYYDSAIATFPSNNDIRTIVGLGHAYNNKGLVANQLDDYKNSLEHYLKALGYYERSKYPKYEIIAYNNLTNLYRSTQDPEKAFEYAEKAFALTKKVKDENLVNCAYLNYGFELAGLGQYEKAEALILQRKESVLENGYFYDLQYFYSYLGRIYCLQQKYSLAESYLMKGLKYAEQTGDKISICEALGFLIKNQIGSGDLTSSKTNIERLEKIARSIGSKYHQLASLDCNYQWCRASGDYKAALTYSERAFTLRDSLLNSRNKIHMNYTAEKYQLEKNNQELAQLQKDNEIQELLIRNRSILNYIFLCITLLSIGMLLSLWLYFRHKQRVSDQEKQFMIMSSLLKGQEKERSRLAKDLHDGIGCILTSLKYSLASLKRNTTSENEEYARIYNNSMDIIDTSIRELRRVAYNMMPEALLKFGLDEGLKDFCQFIKTSNGVNIQYQSFGLNDRMDNDTEIVLYRIVQELLTNVVKHSYATETFVQLVKDGSRLNISVEDNGKGFDVDKIAKKKSTGWLSLQSRVNYLKGRLEVSSILEKGTTIAIEFNV